MIVIHPTDSSTDFLKILYNDVDEKTVYNSPNKENIRGMLLKSYGERLMILGHGTMGGLLARTENGRMVKHVINHKHSYILQNHGNDLIGIFCFASDFARDNNLHGLFTGMFISEKQEADMCGVKTTEEEVEKENIKFVERLASLLKSGKELKEIPSILYDMAKADGLTELTEFNYSKIVYM